MTKLIKGLAIALFALMFSQSAFAAADHGSPDEAIALVKKAVAYMNANGKEKAYAAFNDPKGQFVDRDLYIFVFDMTGKTLAHGANAKLLDKDLSGLKDVDGKLFVKSFLDLVNTKGSGWVDYKWTNPISKGIDQKSSYVMKVGDVLVGCGIYK